MRPELKLRSPAAGDELVTITSDTAQPLRSLLETLEASGFQGAIGFMQGRRGEMIRLNGNTLEAADGPLNDAELGGLWEIDLWIPGRRWRWHRQLGAVTTMVRAANTSEATVNAGGEDSTEAVGPSPVAVHGYLTSQIVLWGSGIGERARPGWSYLADSRVGQRGVPLADVAADDRVMLAITEVVTVDEHGNASVVDELPGQLTTVSQESINER